MNFRGWKQGIPGAALVLTALLGWTGAAHAEVLFEDNFENQPTWNGNPDPASVGGICTGSDCNNLPQGWSMYLTKGCNQKCSLTIEQGPANDGLDGHGGNKSLYYWYTEYGNWANDAQLSKHFNATLEQRKGYPELVLRYRIRWDPLWEFDASGADDPQMKMGRFGNYLGNGERYGAQSHDDWPWPSNINDQAIRPMTYYGRQRLNGGGPNGRQVLHYLSPRCDAYQDCGSLYSSNQWNYLRYVWNYTGAKYCDGSPEGPAEQCLPTSSPYYKPKWGDANCADGSCNGATVPPNRSAHPANYGTGYQDGYGCGGSTGLGGDCTGIFNHSSPGADGDGDWHVLTFRLVVNSSPGTPDGIFQVWFDDELVHDIDDLMWMSSNFFNDCSGDGGPQGTGCPTPPNTDYLVEGWNYFGLGGNAFFVNPSPVGGDQWYAIDDVVAATSLADLNNHPWYTSGPACGDGVDNDGDGLVDTQDPGCSSPTDTSERAANLVCDDGADNDGDGAIDNADAGCSSPTDNDEANCGDGTKNGNEVCDGADLGGDDCTDHGFGNPQGLACNATCTAFNTSQCTTTQATCGDGVVNQASEACDGSDLGGQDCTDLGFLLPGGLSCNASCQYDTSSCSNEQPVAACMTFDEVDDYVSVADSGALTLPNGDWTVGAYTRLNDTTGNAFQYLISTNSPAANNSLNMLLDESASSWEARIRDAQGDQVVLDGGAVPGNGTWRLIAMRRTGSRFDLLYCGTSGCTVEATATDSAVGSIDGGVWNIGRRVDADPNRYFGGQACHAFKIDAALSDNALQDVANWVSPLDAGVMHLGADLQADRTGNGHNGTWHGGIQVSPLGPPQTQPSCGNGTQESGEQCDQGDLGGQTCQTAGFGGGTLTCSASCTLNTTGCNAGSAPPPPDNVERTDTQD